MTDRSVITEESFKQTQEEAARYSKQNRFDILDKTMIWAYGVGHFINDLVAACWFNYLFYYLQKVVKTDAATAAMLSGQICDGLATPIVGYLSDKYNTRWGQRTPWYVFGLVLVFCCYIPIYQHFKSGDNWEYAYYTIFPGLFNVGWASLQISHMSLVPSLTCSRKRRDRLNNLRNSFTFISNFTVLGLGSLIFKFMTNPALQYRIISYFVASLGLSASIFFLYHIKEVPLTKACREKAQALKEEIANTKKIDKNKLGSATEFSQDQDGDQVHLSKNLTIKAQSIKDWFKLPKFYLFGICYMGVRLYTNIFGTFLPFYLIGVLKLGVQKDTTADEQVPFTVALVPLIVYLSSVIVSPFLNKFYSKFGRKTALLFGTLICTICLGSMYFLSRQTNWVMYILAVFIGISQTLVLATGINFISDVVGTKAKTGAFVFGCYSLLDKFSAGLVIFVVGNSPPYKNDKNPYDLTEDQMSFITNTFILIPVLSCIMASAIVLAYPIQEYSKRKDNIRKSSLEEQLVT